MSDVKVVTTQPKSGLVTNAKAVAIATGIGLLSVNANAAPAEPDVTEVLTYIGYAVAAVAAIGSAKMIPAAAMWLYSSLTGMVKRG